ncbi:MAG: LPS-assembly protein LptD [Opitutales bacterium]|nr:LPS-assembly protein LptD [Opitutales bacterium]
MKFILQIIAFLCAIAFCTSAYAQDVSVNAKKTDATAVSSSSSSAVKPQKKRQRRDIPWVSLAHQRKLRSIANGEVVEEKSSEKKGNYITRLMRDSSVELSADKTEYANDETGKLIAVGGAKITGKKFEILADKIEFSEKQSYAKTSGDVKLSTERERITARDIYVNFGNDAMTSGYVKFGSSPVFAESASLKGDEKKVELGESVMYIGEPHWLSMNVRTSSIKYDRETELLEMEDVTMRVGEVPFFYIPSYSQYGLKRPPYDVNTRVGYNSDYGAFIRNNLYYNGLGEISPGILLDYYTKRSVLFGPAANYKTELANSIMEGWFQGAYIDDNGGRDILGEDSWGNEIERERFFIELRHKQMISDRVGITGNISYWSDEYVTRDFRPELFYDNQVPDNFAEAIYYGDYFTGSVFTRFSPNSWEFVQQRLPEVRMDLQPVEIFKTGAYQTGYMSYAYLREFDPTSIANYKYSNRADAYYGITRPIQLSSWSKFTPVIGGRATYYANARGKSSDYMRFLGQIGFDAQMDIWGAWEYESQTMGIDGIRHHMIPQISYRFIPNAEQGDSRIAQIDDNYITTYPPVLDLGDLRNTDEIWNTNTMRFGLQNIFETRDEEYGSREIARFDIYQDVNFDGRRIPNRDYKESYSDLFINASLSPARWLTIGTYTRYNLDYLDVPEVNTYLGLFDGDAFSAYLVTSYLDGSINQYSAHVEYRISERYKLFGRWHYDAELSKFTHQVYGLWTRVGNSWVVEYFISERSGSTRQNSLSFGARISVMIF